MPQMGVSVSEGTITKWLKSRGRADRARRGAARDLHRQGRHRGAEPGEGVVAKILVQEGETVEVGTVLAVIAPAGAEVEAPAGGADGSPLRARDRRQRPTRPRPQRARRAEPTAPTAPPAGRQLQPRAGSGNGRTFVSPVVARIAAEHGVDPAASRAPARGGRVTKKDILAFVESGASAQALRKPRCA